MNEFKADCFLYIFQMDNLYRNLDIVRQNTLDNNDIYKQRRSIVEHPFGTIKRALGYNFFLRRQIDNVDAEAASMFIAYNFKRLLSMFSTLELIKKFEEISNYR